VSSSSKASLHVGRHRRRGGERERARSCLAPTPTLVRGITIRVARVLHGKQGAGLDLSRASWTYGKLSALPIPGIPSPTVVLAGYSVSCSANARITHPLPLVALVIELPGGGQFLAVIDGAPQTDEPHNKLRRVS
jgi:hypothetical protein